MNKIRVVVLFAVCCIHLIACSDGKSADIYEPADEYRQEENAEDDVVGSDAEETAAIREYSLQRNTKSKNDIEEPEYLLEKDFVGKGVFQSEYVTETDAFIAGLLMEAIEQQGRIPEGISRYFSDQAIGQLQETDWTLLHESWAADSYFYDSYYTITWLFGNVGYDFTYSFFPDKGTQAVNMRILIDPCGSIRTVDADICERSGESGDLDTQGLFREEYVEKVIEEGLVYQRKYLWSSLDTEGTSGKDDSSFPASGDMALSGERLGEILITLLESRGEKTDEYRELFKDENTFLQFQESGRSRLETDWKANRYYDCYFIDTFEETGCVEFLYNIYPDYEKMDTDQASAVTLRCSVDVHDGKLSGASMETCPMPMEEYHEARTWTGQRIVLMEKGGSGIIGYDTVTLPIPGEQGRERTPEELRTDILGKRLIADLDAKALENGEIKELLAEERAEWLTDIADRMEEELETGWKIREDYDCYYYIHDRRAERVHYRYYFYFDKQGMKTRKALALDLLISKDGIETMKEHWFMTEPDTVQMAGQPASGKPSTVISPFLTFDWTADDVLMSHSISPEDSARGWEFSLADADFDGGPEMLVTFTANHCGGNSLYIYKQDGNEVSSLADTYATFEEDVAVYIENYGRISPYLDVELLDVYVDADGGYKYLSLDYSLFGGDERGGYGNLVLYATTLCDDSGPLRVMEFNFNCPGEEREIYFLGDRVYELGRLRDLLAEYMDGYTKMEMELKTSEVIFPREIIAMDETEKRQWLEELYESLRDLY